MSFDEEDIEVAFARCVDLIHADPLLAREYERSGLEFFVPASRVSRGVVDDMARRRHLEWFLLERASPELGALAVERLAERAPGPSGFADVALFQVFFSSHVGIFEVTGIDVGQGVWLRDLASQGEYPVVEPRASSVLAAGDLIVGRLFPIGDGLHRASRAAAFFRDPRLTEALRGDLSRARAGRRGSLRVSQAEIEGMFFGAEPRGRPADPPADPVADARALLSQAGIDDERIEEWFAALSEATFERAPVLPGASDALTPILDELAFDSALDLDAARRALVFAWEALALRGSGQGPSVTPAPRPGSAAARNAGHSAAAPEGDVASLVRELDRLGRTGASIQPVLSEIEARLETEDESTLVEDDPTEGGAGEGEGEEAPAPDFPGVVAAMIEEFLWETEHAAGPERARELRRIESLGRATQHVGVFENLHAQDLLVYAAHWLPEHGGLETSDAARAQIAALQSFTRWVEETQEIPLHTAFKEHAAALSIALPRIVQANQHRTRAADTTEGELLEIVGLRTDPTPGPNATTRTRGGLEHACSIEHDLAGWLRVGDWLRARRLEHGQLAVLCCYPASLGVLLRRNPRTPDEFGS